MIAWLVLLLLVPMSAWAESVCLTWTNDPAPLASPTMTVYRSSTGAPGSFVKVADLSGTATTYCDATVPTTWTTAYYYVQSANGQTAVVSRAVNVVTPPPPPPPVPVEDPRIGTLERQLAGICRAAKAMGGTSTSLAGRLRKEIPCL